MDLLQTKLTKSEWDNIEIPISKKEATVLNIIKDGYHNVNIKYNNTISFLKYLKISYTSIIEEYIFIQYLQPIIKNIIEKYNLSFKTIYKDKDVKKSMKKADIIRFSNINKNLETHKEHLFEYIILDLLDNMFKYRTQKSEQWLKFYYTIKNLIDYDVVLVNKIFKTFITNIIDTLEDEINIEKLIELGDEIIERNSYLLKCANIELYEHQKQLFTICKKSNPKLILYIAPTGTGKTLSPIGLSENHRIIFVCAARHVGLSLAKACISCGKKVAFAFGCNDAEDIRLHYFAAKDYSKNKKTGGIGKVDNSVGDKVEIMISDIKSYIPAMYYMLAFNEKEKIILYWDEPTITMDYNTHQFHNIIKANWNQNLIPNVVLSSATLPHSEEINETINDFHEKFDNADIHSIISYDCKKTIPLINKEGFVEMPHYLFEEYDLIKQSVIHCEKYKTLLRYIDLGEAIRFIKYINDNSSEFIKSNRYNIKRNFPSIESVNMINIKMYYLSLLKNLNYEKWDKIYEYMLKTRKQRHKSNIYVVTKDAHTFTDGPTIFLANDVEKIAKFCLQSASIPQEVLNNIMSAIKFNSGINEKIRIMQKTLEDLQKKDEGKERKLGNENRGDPEMRRLINKIQELQSCIKTMAMNSIYVPNSKEHIDKFVKENNEIIYKRAFTSDISEHNIQQIMQIDDIDDNWKLLLMIGIGVFTSHKSKRYTEIMKDLAQTQKLYMIIASSDYIYGTNYQFCHSYISKDLSSMSQEKCIQAMGRVGRNQIQQDYTIRFRDNDLIKKLFQNDVNKPEVNNMSLLFNSL